MKYNFDEIINRDDTLSLKWKNINGEYIPMGLADMDFQAPYEVREALVKRAEHSFYGYGYVKEELCQAIVDRMEKLYSWKIQKDWISFLPGVLDGVTTSIRAYTNEEDGVIIQKPVYTPFMKIINANNRKIVDNKLVRCNNKYHMDLRDLQQKAIENKLMILCSPHNPVGRVWSREELSKVSEIANKENLIVISDEIHSDIVLNGNTHIPIASTSKEMEGRTITLMSASKSFNVPGLSQAFAIIPNKELREDFDKLRVGMNKKNIFGLIALQACYENGSDYLEELKSYLNLNLEYIKEYFNDNIQDVDLMEIEGTYLLWMDFSKVFKTRNELNEFINNECKLILNEGYIFDEEHYLYQRLNFACPRSMLEEALNRIRKGIEVKLNENI